MLRALRSDHMNLKVVLLILALVGAVVAAVKLSGSEDELPDPVA